MVAGYTAAANSIYGCIRGDYVVSLVDNKVRPWLKLLGGVAAGILGLLLLLTAWLFIPFWIFKEVTGG